MAKRDRDNEEWERWVAKTLPARHLLAPPPGTLRKAIALGSGLEAPAGAGSWLVELLFDSAAQPLPAGVRAAVTGQRRLLYRARSKGGREIELDLRIRREPGGALELTGQLLPPWRGATVVAFAGRVRRKRALADTGEFLIKRLPSRPDRLRLEIDGEGGDELIVQDVQLPEPPAEAS